MTIADGIFNRVCAHRDAHGAFPSAIYLGYQEWIELMECREYLSDRLGKITYGHTEIYGFQIYRVVALSHLAVS
jgi:hypothetical protein